MHLRSFHLVSITTFSCNSKKTQGNLIGLYACSVISQITVPFFASSCTKSLFAVSLKALHAELISEWYYKTILCSSRVAQISATSLHSHWSLGAPAHWSVYRPNKVTSRTEKKMSSDKGRGIWTFQRLNPASAWLTGEINMHNLPCPFSSNVPASMCRRPIGYRSCDGGIHEADLHRLPKTGGNQIKDTCGLVLHADQRKRRSSKSDSCRLQLCCPIWNGASRQFVNWHLFSPPRFTSLRTTARPTWTALSKAASAGMAAKICKTSPSEFSMSRTTTAACTSATWSASLSLTTSSPQSPWPRTSGCLWRRKVRLTALHFVNYICLHCLFTASVKWILRWWKLPHLDDLKKTGL